MNRRQLLITTSALALAGCQPGTPTTSGGGPTNPLSGVTLTQALQGVAALSAQAQAIYQQLVAAGMKIGSGTATTVQTILTQIQNAAAALTPVSTAVQGQSVLQQVESYINTLIPIAQPFLAMIPGAGSILAIVVAALPAIEAGFNMVVSFLTPATTAVAAPSPTAAALNPVAALDKLIALPRS